LKNFRKNKPAGIRIDDSHPPWRELHIFKLFRAFTAVNPLDSAGLVDFDYFRVLGIFEEDMIIVCEGQSRKRTV